jgi:chromosomal replication initiation ATPase DnaA
MRTFRLLPSSYFLLRSILFSSFTQQFEKWALEAIEALKEVSDYEKQPWLYIIGDADTGKTSLMRNIQVWPRFFKVWSRNFTDSLQYVQEDYAANFATLTIGPFICNTWVKQKMGLKAHIKFHAH